MQKPEESVILYAHVKKSNKQFLESQARKFKFKSLSKYLDAKIDSLRKSAKRSRNK